MEEPAVAYSSYSLFVAEVASNFNQAMMRGHLLKTIKDKNFLIALIEEAVAGTSSAISSRCRPSPASNWRRINAPNAANR
jgi:oligoendopeptidase F